MSEENNIQKLKILFISKNSKYKKEKLIGKGTFGEIFKVSDTNDKNFYALKFISIADDNNSKLFKEQYEKEI